MRCFGIDWLEFFVSETTGIYYDPDGFRDRGYEVSDRGYGTKTMEQMFTIHDEVGDPMIEIRRLPRGLNNHSEFNIYTFGDSYVRLANKYCYIDNPVQFLVQFCEANKYTIKKIYRIDIYTDFFRFDTGDRPDKVMRRIITHKYAKVNQTHRRTSGNDTWTECFDNWISWGAKGSMVSTKIYNKTLELKETGMKKPWILDHWFRCGLIDNHWQISKDGIERDIYRLEFSIKGSAKGWIVIDKADSYDGNRHLVPHNVQAYSEPRGVLNALINLIPYYFHFRIYREGVRKSLCKDKPLFDFSKDDAEFGYRLVNASDVARKPTQWIIDEQRAIRALAQAYGILKNTDNGQAVLQVINAIQSKVAASVDAARDYTKNTIDDIWKPQ